MKLSDVKTFRDLCSSMFVLNFDPEDKSKPKRARKNNGTYIADNPKTRSINEAYAHHATLTRKK